MDIDLKKNFIDAFPISILLSFPNGKLNFRFANNLIF